MSATVVVIIIVILILLALTVKKYGNENFTVYPYVSYPFNGYVYYPPSNCMETLLDGTVCFPWTSLWRSLYNYYYPPYTVY